MRGRIILALSSLALAFAASAQEPTPAPTPLPMSGPPSVESPAPSLVDDVIRLWKANLSEGFIEKYVANSRLAQDLTADDVVKLRAAGVPETLIASLTERRPAAERRSEPPLSRPAPNAARRWDGLARRNSGVVLFKSRWDPGTLEFKDGTLRWTDARDTAKNLLIPVEQMREQQLTCLKKPGENECFEWVVKTRHEEYRFRDVAWEQGRDDVVQDVFEFFRGTTPNLIASRTPVDSK